MSDDNSHGGDRQQKGEATGKEEKRDGGRRGDGRDKPLGYDHVE